MRGTEVSPPAAASIIPFPRSLPLQVGFERAELTRILDLYGRMVAAGEWRDYAMNFDRDAASFAAFRRTAERPTARIEKRPALRGKQGMWTLYGEAGRGAGVSRTQTAQAGRGLIFLAPERGEDTKAWRLVCLAEVGEGCSPARATPLQAVLIRSAHKLRYPLPVQGRGQECDYPNVPILLIAATIAWLCSAPDCGTISPVRSMIWAQAAATPSAVRSSGASAAPGVRVTNEA